MKLAEEQEMKGVNCMSKTTIITDKGETISGEEVSRESDSGNSLGDILGGIVTGGLREILKPNDTVTVKDSEGNFHTGKEK